MESEEFEVLLEARIGKIKGTLSKKGEEYSGKLDRLYNFKRASEIQHVSPEKALLGMLSKHLVSVMDLIEGNLKPSKENCDEKIGDSINYLILLEALFAEQREDDIKGPHVHVYLR